MDGSAFKTHRQDATTCLKTNACSGLAQRDLVPYLDTRQYRPTPTVTRLKAQTHEFDVGGRLDHSGRVKCIVDFFGSTDFLQMDEHTPAGERHDSQRSYTAAHFPESRLVGRLITEHCGRVARANPITYVTPEDSPFPHRARSGE